MTHALRLELDTRAAPEDAGAAAASFLLAASDLVGGLVAAAAARTGDRVVAAGTRGPGTVAFSLATAARGGSGARGSRGGVSPKRLAAAAAQLRDGVLATVEVEAGTAPGPVRRRLLALVEVDYRGAWLNPESAHLLSVHLDLGLLDALGETAAVADRLWSLAAEVGPGLGAVGGFLVETAEQASRTREEDAAGYGHDYGLRLVDRQVRGAGWGTLLPPAAVDMLGGADRVAAEAPVAAAVPFPNGAAWLRLAGAFPPAEGALDRLRAYLGPVLPRERRPRSVPDA
ncbi:MAG TPA: hypothetical protein VFQ85_05010 [Mycobacteriales bacterium]|nr:hypothetical protein [Mycobacteriales bacterium]